MCICNAHLQHVTWKPSSLINIAVCLCMCVCLCMHVSWQMSITDKGHAFITRQTFTEGQSGFSPAPIDSYEQTSNGHSTHAVDRHRFYTNYSCRNGSFVVLFSWKHLGHCNSVICLYRFDPFGPLIRWELIVLIVQVMGRSCSSSDGTDQTLCWWRPKGGRRWPRPPRCWTDTPHVRYEAARVWTFPPLDPHF